MAQRIPYVEIRAYNEGVTGSTRNTVHGSLTVLK